jgi:hypothetical protein
MRVRLKIEVMIDACYAVAKRAHPLVYFGSRPTVYRKEMNAESSGTESV